MLEDDDFEMSAQQAKLILVTYAVVSIFFVTYFSITGIFL